MQTAGSSSCASFNQVLVSLIDFQETVACQLCVENLHTEFHENPTRFGLGTRSRTDGRSIHIRRFYFLKMYDSFR